MVTARFLVGRREVDVPLLNPGEWLGRVWMVMIDNDFVSFYVGVEAYDGDEVVNIIARHPTYRRHVVIPEGEVESYLIHPAGPDGPAEYDVVMVDDVPCSVHGIEFWPVDNVRYFGTHIERSLPADGVLSTEFDEWND